MNPLLDTAAPPRSGEEIDAGKLAEFLAATFGPIGGPVEIEQFRKGHSNLTYLVRFDGRELVLRRPPFGSQVKTAHDMSREYTILSKLAGAYAPAPKPAAICEDESILGAKFYLMERIVGWVPRSKPPEGMEIAPETARACCRSFIENLAALHALDYRALGLDALHRPGWYAQRQVLGWADRYEKSKTDDVSSMVSTIDWLKERIPADTGLALIHNDYKFDNLVLDPADPARIIGVLDWEMSTIGDPLMDLGTSLGYWAEGNDPPGLRDAQCFMTGLPGSMTRMELAEEYARITGRDISNILFYYVFSLFKIAVIVQQIYYRYVQGNTNDERFAGMIFIVAFLGDRAIQAIDCQRI